MSNEKNRNEVNLSDEDLDILKKRAQKDGRSLKNYLEKVLIKHTQSGSNKKSQTESLPKSDVHL